MTNRRTRFLTFAAVALFTLLLPATVSAQRPWWERDRDDNYGRDRYGRISDQERRHLRDVARRINDRSKDFQRDIDRLLDNSRYDDTRREDRVNEEVRDFRRAAERFKDRAGDSNDLSRSTNEARQLLSEASRVERLLSRLRLDARTSNSWQQIRADLRTVANIYGIRTGNFDGGYGRGRNDDYYGRGRNDDYYGRGRNDDRRDRNRRNNRRFPF